MSEINLGEKKASISNAEVVHSELRNQEGVKTNQSFGNFLVGYLGLCSADLMTGYMMYSEGTLQRSYIEEFQALSGLALMSSFTSVIHAVTPPIVANSGDIFGYKQTYLMSLFIFILGCALSGLSVNWNMFIAAACIRSLGQQGLSISGSIVISTALPLRKRGLWSSVQNVIYILTALTAPLVAATFTTRGKWRHVFYIWLSLSVLVFPLILKMKLPQKTAADWHAKVRQIDYIGFILIIAGTTLITLSANWGGTKYPWNSVTIIACLVCGVLFFAAFVVYVTKLVKLERPVIQLRLFKKSPMNWAIAANIFQSAGVFGWMLYLNLYAKAVNNVSDREYGYIGTPYVVASTFAGITEGLILTKYGLVKPFLLVSPLITITGISLTFAFTETSKALVFISTGVVGLGVGMQYLSLVLSTQSCHPIEDIAQVVMLLGFLAGIFGSFFSSVTGAVFNATFASKLKFYLPPDTPDAIFTAAKTGASLVGMNPQYIAGIKDAWSGTIRVLAWYAIGMMLLTYICSLSIKPYKLTENIGDEPVKCKSKGIRGFLGLETPANHNTTKE
ncbi:hypothetical protein K7432_008917 [Basidiobolus ranarum]|uniref:Major facilitator superfamily (MFS) profile domain-containing protein n=1 Tax=Basidiobolus ranarum TaxID=34480 RepID=A0ABR2WR37_9FUNG